MARAPGRRAHGVGHVRVVAEHSGARSRRLRRRRRQGVAARGGPRLHRRPGDAPAGSHFELRVGGATGGGRRGLRRHRDPAGEGGDLRLRPTRSRAGVPGARRPAHRRGLGGGGRHGPQRAADHQPLARQEAPRQRARCDHHDLAVEHRRPPVPHQPVGGGPLPPGLPRRRGAARRRDGQGARSDPGHPGGRGGARGRRRVAPRRRRGVARAVVGGRDQRPAARRRGGRVHPGAGRAAPGCRSAVRRRRPPPRPCARATTAATSTTGWSGRGRGSRRSAPGRAGASPAASG